MVDLVEIKQGAAHLVLAPELGGTIARLDVNGLPVLRPWTGDQNNVFSLASNILTPFSNRISGGGFNWDGNFYEVEPNLDGEKYPIHGDGFQKVWDVDQIDEHTRLTLADGHFGPWNYSAVQEIVMTENSLSIALSIVNVGDIALPFGCGFHPWFPRSSDTKLSFQAESIWLEDDQYLPTKKLSLANAPDWNFENSRSLPKTWINNGYVNWNGVARIDQGEDAQSVHVTASDNLNTALVFSPSGDADFFCFEPVSHPVDAFHLEGNPGLVSLDPGETMTASMTISWEE